MYKNIIDTYQSILGNVKYSGESGETESDISPDIAVEGR